MVFNRERLNRRFLPATAVEKYLSLSFSLVTITIQEAVRELYARLDERQLFRRNRNNFRHHLRTMPIVRVRRYRYRSVPFGLSLSGTDVRGAAGRGDLLRLIVSPSRGPFHRFRRQRGSAARKNARALGEGGGRVESGGKKEKEGNEGK